MICDIPDSLESLISDGNYNERKFKLSRLTSERNILGGTTLTMSRFSGLVEMMVPAGAVSEMRNDAK